MPRPFKKILVANRGEIAVRIIRACRELDVETVAVYSEPDRGAPHVLLADEAYPLPGAESHDTYLNQELLIATARQAGAEAIHPGYGFLAENPTFAGAVPEAGLAFIGPSAEAIELMGKKAGARQRMKAAGVPVTPGSEGLLHDVGEVKALAREIGYPLLIKAASGGGGRGMRIVRTPEEIAEAYDSARREAGTAFGDPSLYVERFIENPKHIEVQLLADAHGHCIHLLERECSVQRKHQKLVEECPSTALTPELRAEMGQIAVRAAQAVHYVNAGTVEFLFEPPDHFYFMEMNTRIQVEHPVTELVTGVDLVKWQIRIAAGERLTLRQEDIVPRGWAVECRINAEDPLEGFLPTPGRIEHLTEPGGPGLRLDSGIRKGFCVPRFYDSMVAKLVAWGEDRDEALARMRRALREYHILGIKTTIPLHQRILEAPAFLDGTYSTSFLERFLGEHSGFVSEENEQMLLVAAALARYLALENNNGRPTERRPESPWKLLGKMERMRKLQG
jgi:acetyl-CoA carboxylase, biotin carboxylase subunit